jgi:N-acetylneuraminic acid mutarotase
LGIVAISLASGGKWERKADMTSARLGHAAAVVNNKIYVIGGAKQGFVNLSIVEEYDPATDTWTKKADMPTTRYALAASALDVGYAGWLSLAFGGEDDKLRVRDCFETLL